MVAQKDHEARSLKPTEVRSSIEAKEEKTAPFTIKCLSSEAEVFKISNLDLHNILKKDNQTKMAIFENYKKKRQLYMKKSMNMHMDLKFASNLVQ